MVVIKIKETGELVGGYNPVCWNIEEKSLNERYWIETDKSFIFKIDEDEINNSILSRVKHPEHAIFHNGQKVNEAIDNINFHEITANFNHLRIYNSTNNDPYCYYFYYPPSYSSFNYYKNCLNLRNKTRNIHLIEDYEVYKIV